MRITRLDQWVRQEVYPRLSLPHLGAAALLTASALANFKYGISLGDGKLGVIIGGVAAIGAEAAGAVSFLLLAGAAKARKVGQALAVLLVMGAALSYNLHSGLGFQSYRDEIVGRRAAATRADQARTAEIARIDNRLKALGNPRPEAELKALMDAILADRRAGGCAKLDGPYTKSKCPVYFQLRSEHGRAVERTRLLANRQKLMDDLMKVDSITKADPTESKLITYLAQLGVRFDEGALAPWSALLFVLLMVLGGPLLLWLAESRIEHRKPAPPQENEQTKIESIPPAVLPATIVERVKPVPPVSSVTISNSEASSVGNVVPIRKQAQPRRHNPKNVSPSGQRLLEALREKGGSAKGYSQASVAKEVGMARTTYCREAERLRSMGYLMLTEDKGQIIVRLLV